MVASSKTEMPEVVLVGKNAKAFYLVGVNELFRKAF